ncbi:phosphotransferase [Ruegeria sp.]|uniref:phosphotransferase n=1 Tax=Ruegeria sp. TaxID=1879320 RepID=UPI003B5CDD10
MTAPPNDLVDDLRRRGLVAAGAQFQTLYGGRTNQVWKVLGEDGGKVLKLYRSGLRNPLFRNDAASEADCLRALEHTGFAPRLRANGQHPSGQWVFYDHAPGSPWRTGPDQAAGLLRRLHRLDISVAAPKGCNGSADLALHGQGILDKCTSAMRLRLEELRPRAHIEALASTCLIHGDPVAGNILVAASGLTLIDWQCPAIGDPCEDLAMFLSPAMQHLYRGSALTSEEEDQFLAAYGCARIVDRYRSLRPWYAWRMAAYCLWRIENGAPDYAAGMELELAAL